RRDHAALSLSVRSVAAARRDPDDAPAGTCRRGGDRLPRLGALFLLCRRHRLRRRADRRAQPRRRMGGGARRRPAAARRRRSVLFLGAGRHQRAAILRAKELGIRVAAIDGNPDALGLPEADIAEVVNFVDIPQAIAFAERLRPDGVLTITSDRAVVAVAAVAEALGLPGIGVDVALGLTHKIEMRRRIEAGGLPQPRFGGARTLEEARAAAEHVGFPSVIKPADSG